MVSPSIEFPQIMKTPQNNLKVAQPTVTVAEISDPTTASENIEVINQDLVQLWSEPLRARRVIVRLEASVLIYQSTNLAVRTRTKLEPGRMGVVAFGPRAKGTVNGLLIHPDLMLIAAVGTEGQFVVEGGYESIIVSILPADLEVHLRARQQWERFHMPGDIDLHDCDAAKVSAFFSWGKRLADTAARQPDLFEGRKEVCAAVQIELVEMLLEAISSADRHPLTRTDKTRQDYSHVVRLAEDYVLTQTDAPLRVPDLCKAAAVSERKLQYAFEEVMGMSPVAYLKRLRLHRVQQALKAATHGTTTVSAEALRWGFWHFGDFSHSYKTCFGELPSDTLRREPSRS
jgi:AraC family transcriptional regulator, ethanolamine operon transcriptional activator